MAATTLTPSGVSLGALLHSARSSGLGPNTLSLDLRFSGSIRARTRTRTLRTTQVVVVVVMNSFLRHTRAHSLPRERFLNRAVDADDVDEEKEPQIKLGGEAQYAIPQLGLPVALWWECLISRLHKSK